MNDLRTVAIRAGEAADAESISMLILGLAERFVLPEFSAEGRERFSTAHTPAAIAALVESGYRYLVAECGGELGGCAVERSAGGGLGGVVSGRDGVDRKSQEITHAL